MEILLATTNEQKAKEIQLVLGYPVHHVAIDLPEIQAIDVHEVIKFKAQAAYEQIGKPVLVEDTSLAIKSWNGLPGALIRWFLKAVGNEGLCRMLSSFNNLEAVAETCIGYFDGEAFFSFTGITDGTIVRSPIGNNGFGWDPIFMPSGADKTFAEMTTDEKVSFSMRRKAVLQFRDFLNERKP